MTPTVLITGGGTGIGAATARRMAADGWDVCVAGRRTEPLERLAEEIGALAVRADIGQPSGAGRVVDACLERSGRLDAVVISAGTGAGGTVGDQTLERWNRVLTTNLTGAFLVIHEAIDALIDASGAIVTVASLAGLHASPESVAYCSSKAGLIMLTRCVAVDYGPRGVRANCVCPGWIETEMGDRAMDELAGLRGVDRAGAYALATEHAPARRPGRPEETAEAIAWLASSAASYVNGAVLTVDGGLSIVDAGSLAFASGRVAPATPTPEEEH
ncbi:MAG: SDR family NAD(P)-dependent oxidoreductase [Solirubrobacteraceae bacterium]